eukprot:jgi/Hompol1/1881/HPOL_005767-RA
MFDIEQAEAFLKIFLDNYQAVPRAFSGLIRASVKLTHSLDWANVYWKQMRKLHVVPDQSLMTTMIAANVDAGNLKGALDLFCQMLDMGLSPTPFVYNTLIKLYGCAGRTKDMDRLFQFLLMPKNGLQIGIQANVFLMTALMSGYSFAGEFDKAIAVWKRMWRGSPATVRHRRIAELTETSAVRARSKTAAAASSSSSEVALSKDVDKAIADAGKNMEKTKTKSKSSSSNNSKDEFPTSLAQYLTQPQAQLDEQAQGLQTNAVASRYYSEDDEQTIELDNISLPFARTRDRVTMHTKTQAAVIENMYGVSPTTACVILDVYGLKQDLAGLEELWTELKSIEYPMIENMYTSYMEGLIRCGMIHKAMQVPAMLTRDLRIQPTIKMLRNLVLMLPAGSSEREETLRMITIMYPAQAGKVRKIVGSLLSATTAASTNTAEAAKSTSKATRFENLMSAEQLIQIIQANMPLQNPNRTGES